MFSSISLFPHFLVTLQWVRSDSQWNRRIFIKNCEISVRCFDLLSFVWENGQCRFVSFLSYLKSYLEELSAFLEKGKWIFHGKPRLEKLSQLWNFSHSMSQLASSLASFYLVIQIIICLHIPVLFYCYWQIDNIQFFGGKDKQCFIGCLLLNDQIEDKLIYPYLLIRSLVFEPTGSVKKLPL